MQEELSWTPSIQKPSGAGANSDDAPQKTNGALSKDGSPGFDTKSRGLPQPSSTPPISSTSPNAAMPLARAGTLSWQQRPTSRGSTGPRSRPLSVLASDNNAAKPSRASAEPDTGSNSSISRGQIAHSLGSKDPSWFKQTQDRGLGSAALRRNQVEDASNTRSTTGSMRLPGMSRDSSAEPEGHPSSPPESVRSNPIVLRGNARGNHFSSSASTSSFSSMRSPLPTRSSQILEPPSSDSTSTSGVDDNSSLGRTLAMSPAQGRISPERMDRPASPTKGLGGFVQSAMLKRSDSVNKRWSAQPGPGLSRGNSIASNLSSYGVSRYPMGGVAPLVESRPSSTSREGSPRPNSRPTSSHSSTTVTRRVGEDDRQDTSTSLASSASRSRVDEDSPHPIPQESESLAPTEEIMSPPASPSKKWSPTKSSWLENALNKPDSPKIRSPAPQQPAWMSEISRAKQHRGSVDLGKETSNFKEVAIGGLVRSPPPGAGYKTPTIGGLPSGFSAGVAAKSRNGSIDAAAQTSASPDPTKINGKASAISSKEVPHPDPPFKQNRTAKDKPAISADTHLIIPPAAPPTTPRLNSRTISPAPRKTKPETPPKKEFISPLKPRQISGEKKAKEEPEFKNVFGNLKRTQTKNYLAPDELKDTIMRGKAGLAQTGGPKKTERKDEFKESILQKKHGMVPPSASTRITSASSKIPDQSTPEAIAKRKVLGRSDSAQSIGSMEEEKQASKPEALAKLAHLRDKPKSIPPGKPSSAPVSLLKDTATKNFKGDNFASSLAGILQRGPSPLAGNSIAVEPFEDKPDGRLPEKARESEMPLDGPQLTHVTKARARGPKRRLPTASKQVDSAKSPQADSEPQTVPGESITSIGNRTSMADNLSKIQTPPSEPKSRPLSNITHNNNNNRKSSQPLSPRKPSTEIAPLLGSKFALPIHQVRNEDVEPKSSPPLIQKPAKSHKDSNIPPSSISTSAATPTASLERSQPQEPQSTSSREQEVGESKAKEDNPALPSVKGVAAIWGQSAKPLQPSRARSPVKLPTRKDEEAAMEEAGLRAKEPVGLANQTPVKERQQSVEREQSITTLSPKSPPLPGKKPSSISNKVPSATLSPPVPARRPSSITNSSSLVKEVFADIFDEPPNFKSRITIDTQAILDSRSSNKSSQKIKTLRKQIFEISDDWKLVPVPSQGEHILFEESSYVCTHVFGTSTGQRMTEVYLWFGDGSPVATFEDAQLFAKRFAKDNNGKLIVLKQGKETTNFFQALGGIVITRRGSSIRADASASSGTAYMLCGRQHVGQIAFDEVDFGPRSLCQAFPYIVSAPDGKLYLWKGSGSGADELGCARLIGMDLGLTGEIEEVDEGREPDVFWESFPSGKRDTVTEQASKRQHWHLKPSCEKYSIRLFNIGTPRPKSGSGPIQGAMQWVRRGSAPASDTNTPSMAQIREVIPFAQSDLSDDGVFVLDAFFEIFV